MRRKKDHPITTSNLFVSIFVCVYHCLLHFIWSYSCVPFHYEDNSSRQSENTVKSKSGAFSGPACSTRSCTNRPRPKQCRHEEWCFCGGAQKAKETSVTSSMSSSFGWLIWLPSQTFKDRFLLLFNHFSFFFVIFFAQTLSKSGKSQFDDKRNRKWMHFFLPHFCHI